MDPELIKAAAGSSPGVLSLMVLLVSSVALAFFKDANTKVRLTVFIFIFAGAAAFAAAVIMQKPTPVPSPAPEPKPQPEPEPSPPIPVGEVSPPKRSPTKSASVEPKAATHRVSARGNPAVRRASSASTAPSQAAQPTTVIKQACVISNSTINVATPQDCSNVSQ